MKRKRIRIGDKVRVSHCSGVFSGEERVIIPFGSIKVDGHGIPLIQGEYHTLEYLRKKGWFFIKTAKNIVFSMHKYRLFHL